MGNKNNIRVLVTCTIKSFPETCRFLEANASVTYHPNPGDDELVSLIPGFTAIITNLQQKIDQRVIDAAVNLKVIATPSTGTDHIDLKYAEQKGITVQSLKNDYDLLKTITSTAEHAFLLMMACLRKLPYAFDSVKKGQWTRDLFKGREVHNRVLGIVGYGRLGEIFSRYAQAFGMKVISHDPCKEITDQWVEQVTFDDLLKRAEIITIHVHLTEETRNLFSEREFSLMRDGVYLINTSRGGLLDEEAFLKALQSGKITGAGIDVLANELDGSIGSDPLVEYARQHNNLIITPHIGGNSYDAQEKAYRFTAEKLIKFFTNE